MNTYPTTYYITDNGKEIEGVLVHAQKIIEIDQTFFDKLSTDRYGSDYNCFLTLEEAKKLGIKPEDTATTMGGYDFDDGAEDTTEEIAIATYRHPENSQRTLSGFLQTRYIADEAYEMEYAEYTDAFCDWQSKACAVRNAIHSLSQLEDESLATEQMVEVLCEYETKRRLDYLKTDSADEGISAEDILGEVAPQNALKVLELVHERIGSAPIWKVRAEFNQIPKRYHIDYQTTDYFDPFTLSTLYLFEALCDAEKCKKRLSRKEWRRGDIAYELIYAPQFNAFLDWSERYNLDAEWRDYAEVEIDLLTLFREVEEANNLPWECFDKFQKLDTNLYLARATWGEHTRATYHTKEANYIVEVEGSLEEPDSTKVIARVDTENPTDTYAMLVWSNYASMCDTLTEKVQKILANR